MKKIELPLFDLETIKKLCNYEMERELSIFQHKEECTEFLEKLDIPVHNYNIGVEDLYNILKDEQKLQQLISRLKNKVFW